MPEPAPRRVALEEPGPLDVVVVVNDNASMVHAGLWVGGRLFDPAGNYETWRRRRQPGWPGPSLRDYLRFQLDDGPDVRVYRFVLQPADFAQVQLRLGQTGFTPPFFCAAEVQNLLSGVPPFESVPRAWLVWPSTVDGHLDRAIEAGAVGDCRRADGAPC